ncbi:MAG: hypothetical protein JNK05_20790 [Myxococcales bacterium]|nr:hypothetical protein [Myxococcales bacterium]
MKTANTDSTVVARSRTSASEIERVIAVRGLATGIGAQRAKYMVDERVGLTIGYNRLMGRGCTEERIVALRAMHEAMDRAVLRAYGWEDLAQRVPPYCASGEADKRAMEAFESEVIERRIGRGGKRAGEERVLGIGKSEKKEKGKKAAGSEIGAKSAKKKGAEGQAELDASGGTDDT